MKKMFGLLSLLVVVSMLLAACGTTPTPAPVPVTPTVDPVALNGAETCPGEGKFVEVSVIVAALGEGKSAVEMSLGCMSAEYARSDDPHIIAQSITNYFVVIEKVGFLGEMYKERLFADFILPIVEGQSREIIVEGEFEIVEVVNHGKGACEALGGMRWRCP